MIISLSASSTDIVARVHFFGSEVLCSFKAHDEAFRKIVKGLGYSWAEEKRAWHRVLNVETNGEPIDRAAELASALINAGFACQVDETVADLVARGAWKPEQKRWVRYINGRYVLSWRGQEDDLYHRALMTALSGIPEGEKVIVWCKYVESVRQIADALDDCALYYGDLSEKQRDEQLKRFRGDCRYLVATQATGGHGLTLNEAHYHIFYENEFKYSHRVQAEDRSHRIGQTVPVTYIDIVANAGIDKRIQEALAKKQDVVRAFRNEIKKEMVEKWRNNI